MSENHKQKAQYIIDCAKKDGSYTPELENELTHLNAAQMNETYSVFKMVENESNRIERELK